MFLRKYLPIISVFSASVLFMILLNVCANKMNTRDNAFIRHFPPHIVSNFKFADIGYNSYYIAGITNNSIYLGNLTAPAYFLVTSRSLEDTHHFHLEVPAGLHLAVDYVRALFNYPDIYLVDKQTRTVLHTKLPSLAISDKYELNPIFLEDIKPISVNSFVCKIYDTSLHQSIISRDSKYVHPYHPVIPVLEKQLDGHFCTDGELLISPENSTMTYVYHYRNQFLCMDTNAQILFKGRTIDTNRIAKIELDTIRLSATYSKYTFKKPPLMVNRISCVYKDKLFINSGLLANNEDKTDFQQSSVIDMYDLKKGNYLYSFYLPDFRGNKIRQFQVFEGGVTALYDRYITTYSLPIY